MKDNELQLVRWFKNELSASISNGNIVDELKERLMILDNQFDTHSPSMSGIHYTPQEKDSQLLKYTVKREAILNQLKKEEVRGKQVQAILSLMPEDKRKTITDIYSKKVTWEQAAFKAEMTRKGLNKQLNKTIKQAVDNYFENL